MAPELFTWGYILLLRVVSFKITSDLDSFVNELRKYNIAVSDVVRKHIPVVLSLRKEELTKHINEMDKNIVRTITVKLEEDVLSKLIRFSEKHGLTVSEVLRIALKIARDRMLVRIDNGDSFVYIPRYLAEKLALVMSNV